MRPLGGLGRAIALTGIGAVIAACGGTILCGPYHSPLGVFSGTGPTADEKKRAESEDRQADRERRIREDSPVVGKRGGLVTAHRRPSLTVHALTLPTFAAPAPG